MDARKTMIRVGHDRLSLADIRATIAHIRLRVGAEPILQAEIRNAEAVPVRRARDILDVLQAEQRKYVKTHGKPSKTLRKLIRKWVPCALRRARRK